MGEWNDRWDESHSAFGSLVPLKRICYPHLLQHRALRCAIARRASVFLFDPTPHNQRPVTYKQKTQPTKA